MRKADVVPVDERPLLFESSKKHCDEVRFVNLFLLLKIGCTLPVIPCECERNFSALRRLKAWFRFLMAAK